MSFLTLRVVLVAVYLPLRALRTLRLGAALLDSIAQELGLIKLNAPKKFQKSD